MSVSLFAAYNLCSIVCIGAVLDDTTVEELITPWSSYIDEGIDVYRPDGTWEEQPGQFLRVEREEHDDTVYFPEQHVDIDEEGEAIAVDAQGKKHVFQFRMSRPMTELEVQVSQTMDLIGAPVTTPL